MPDTDQAKPGDEVVVILENGGQASYHYGRLVAVRKRDETEPAPPRNDQ